MMYSLATIAVFATAVLAQSIDPSQSTNPAAVTACNNARAACQVGPNANQASCAAAYASCLPTCEAQAFVCSTMQTSAAQCAAAYNACKAAPATTSTTAAAPSNGTIYTTTVLSYTTYCPYATTIVHGTNTVTVTAPGYVTVTACPCVITTNAPPAATVVVPATVPATVVVVPTATPVAPTTTKAVYTGAANVVAPAGLLAVAIGAMAAL